MYGDSFHRDPEKYEVRATFAEPIHSFFLGASLPVDACACPFRMLRSPSAGCLVMSATVLSCHAAGRPEGRLRRAPSQCHICRLIELPHRAIHALLPLRECWG